MISFRNVELQKEENQQKGKTKYFLNGNQFFAEEAAISFYQKMGYRALWTENSYWWMLMSLFFWDVIFAKIRGAISIVIDGLKTELDPSEEEFEPIFQQSMEINGMPSDFFTPEFFRRRRNLIKNRIQELLNSDLEEKLLESYKLNFGKKCRPIENWEKYTIDELLIAVKRIEKEKLIKILDRLISNFNENRSGLPDLLVYNDQDFLLVEVKSERDRISEKQKEWHDFLSSTLELHIELFLINHSEAQVEQVKRLYVRPFKEVVISFGFSSSPKREEAIKFVQEQETYFSQGEGKDQIHGAKFKINEEDLEKIFHLLDLTTGWKTQRIEIEGESVKSSVLRSSLWCFRAKIKQKASVDYCKIGEYDNKPNFFGCRNIFFPQFENERWNDFGYIDTSTGEWKFDRKKIEEHLEEQIQRFVYCPLLDAESCRNTLKKFPEKINPKFDRNWAFISNDYDHWFWYEDRWLNTLGETNFPGLGVMVGVEKLSSHEIEKAIKLYKNFSSIAPSGALSTGSTGQSQQKSGCFIATAVYGNGEEYHVQVLRNFRDRRLQKSFLGRVFIRIYYLLSPPIADLISNNPPLKSFFTRIIDYIVRRISKEKF